MTPQNEENFIFQNRCCAADSRPFRPAQFVLINVHHRFLLALIADDTFDCMVNINKVCQSVGSFGEVCWSVRCHHVFCSHTVEVRGFTRRRAMELPLHICLLSHLGFQFIQNRGMQVGNGMEWVRLSLSPAKKKGGRKKRHFGFGGLPCSVKGRKS